MQWATFQLGRANSRLARIGRTNLRPSLFPSAIKRMFGAISGGAHWLPIACRYRVSSVARWKHARTAPREPATRDGSQAALLIGKACCDWRDLLAFTASECGRVGADMVGIRSTGCTGRGLLGSKGLTVPMKRHGKNQNSFLSIRR
jgi:hypothetical protein